MKRLPFRTLLALGLVCAIGFGSGIFQDLLAIYQNKLATARAQAELERKVKETELAADTFMRDFAAGKSSARLPGDAAKAYRQFIKDPVLQEWQKSEHVNETLLDCLRIALTRVTESGDPDLNFSALLRSEKNYLLECGIGPNDFEGLATWSTKNMDEIISANNWEPFSN